MVHPQDLELETEADGLTKGSLVRVFKEQTLPLGPFAGSSLVDLPQEIEELHEQMRQELDRRGIGTVRLPEYDRAEWTGVFTYEVEIVLEVVTFYAETPAEQEYLQANGMAIFYAATVVVSLAIIGYTSKNGAEAIKAAFGIKAALEIAAVAFGLFAVFLIAREIRKTTGALHAAT